jgi:rfaE bifunctional protein nucleotidyltransferase chain/domain
VQQTSTPLASPFPFLLEQENFSDFKLWVREAPYIVAMLGGCFDLLHVGHLDLLEKAGRHADLVVVALNSDSSVRKLKGAGRPIFPVKKRVEALKMFAPSVHHCVIFDGDSPEQIIREMHPNLFIKGAEYLRVELLEKQALNEVKCKVMILESDFAIHTSDFLGKRE